LNDLAEVHRLLVVMAGHVAGGLVSPDDVLEELAVWFAELEDSPGEEEDDE